jgi:hypothetical protein
VQSDQGTVNQTVIPDMPRVLELQVSQSPDPISPPPGQGDSAVDTSSPLPFHPQEVSFTNSAVNVAGRDVYNITDNGSGESTLILEFFVIVMSRTSVSGREQDPRSIETRTSWKDTLLSGWNSQDRTHYDIRMDEQLQYVKHILA